MGLGDGLSWLSNNPVRFDVARRQANHCLMLSHGETAIGLGGSVAATVDEVDRNAANLSIAVATSDGAKANQEAPQKSVFERSSLS